MPRGRRYFTLDYPSKREIAPRQTFSGVDYPYVIGREHKGFAALS